MRQFPRLAKAYKHDQNDPQHSAQPSSPIATMGIVSTTSAENYNQQNDDQNGVNLSPSLDIVRSRPQPRRGFSYFLTASRAASFRPPTAFCRRSAFWEKEFRASIGSIAGQDWRACAGGQE